MIYKDFTVHKFVARMWDNDAATLVTQDNQKPLNLVSDVKSSPSDFC